jgi:threonine synthase
MRYVSTRGDAPDLGFADVLLAGLANDGGLYVPTQWPGLPDVGGHTTYADIAAAVMQPFVGDDLPPGVLVDLCRDAYSTFRHPAVTPLVQIDDRHWLLELFHGPTLAFKDVALQLVGRMFEHVLTDRSQRITIVGATSGDTGSAAIDGVKGCDHVDIVILYPAGRTSEVQRRQMTTVDSPNVHAIAIDGNFDDCQDLVKAMFGDAEFRDDLQLSAVNSINWARVMAQIVYYVTASRALTGEPSFCVPTGNFGNVLAGWIAREMGAPISDFIVASNSNDILTRFFNDGDMTTSEVVPTLSPSMDIQVSSNFERLLFEINGRDGGITAEQLQLFRATGRLSIEPDQQAQFVASTTRRRSPRCRGSMPTPACRSIRTPRRPRRRPAGWAPTTRSSRSRPPTRPSSPMPSSRRPACARRCRPTSLTSSTVPNARRPCRTTWPRSRNSCAPSPGSRPRRAERTRSAPFGLRCAEGPRVDTVLAPGVSRVAPVSTRHQLRTRFPSVLAEPTEVRRGSTDPPSGRSNMCVSHRMRGVHGESFAVSCPSLHPPSLGK